MQDRRASFGPEGSSGCCFGLTEDISCVYMVIGRGTSLFCHPELQKAGVGTMRAHAGLIVLLMAAGALASPSFFNRVCKG